MVDKNEQKLLRRIKKARSQSVINNDIHGYLQARKEAQLVKHAFSDMTPVTNEEMSKRFPGWGEQSK